MPQWERPYFQRSFKEPNELFLNSQNDAVALAALLAELQRRDRAPAISLRGDVLRRLDELNGQGTADESSQHGAESARNNRSQPNSESQRAPPDHQQQATLGHAQHRRKTAICAVPPTSSKWNRWASRADHQEHSASQDRH